MPAFDTYQVRVARWLLDGAFERARAGGYQPGSPEMQALDEAEQVYRQARRRRMALQGSSWPGRPPGVLPQGTDEAADKPAPGAALCVPWPRRPGQHHSR